MVGVRNRVTEPLYSYFHYRIATLISSCRRSVVRGIHTAAVISFLGHSCVGDFSSPRSVTTPSRREQSTFRGGQPSRCLVRTCSCYDTSNNLRRAVFGLGAVRTELSHTCRRAVGTPRRASPTVFTFFVVTCCGGWHVSRLLTPSYIEHT